MYVFFIAMGVFLMLALAVGAVVAIGMKGLYREKSPEVARMLAKTAQHMNGDAKNPPSLEKLFAHSRG